MVKKYMMPYFNTRNTITDLLNIAVAAPNNATNMQPEYFGSNTPSTTFSNSPYTDGPFYGYRLVYQNSPNGTSPHLFTVELHEMYPINGRVWCNTYDTTASNWYGWHRVAMDTDISSLQSSIPNWDMQSVSMPFTATKNGILVMTLVNSNASSSGYCNVLKSSSIYLAGIALVGTTTTWSIPVKANDALTQGTFNYLNSISYTFFS
jgi:hypothetical protein